MFFSNSFVVWNVYYAFASDSLLTSTIVISIHNVIKTLQMFKLPILQVVSDFKDSFVVCDCMAPSEENIPSSESRSAPVDSEPVSVAADQLTLGPTFLGSML